MTEAARPDPTIGEEYQHYKNPESRYTVVGISKAGDLLSQPITGDVPTIGEGMCIHTETGKQMLITYLGDDCWLHPALDYRCVLYRKIADDTLWARPLENFLALVDGVERFKKLSR